MIGALCMNPCVDRTVTIGSFTYGGMNRITSAREDGSGKGVNVALALDQIGTDALCVSTLGIGNGEIVEKRFRGTGIVCEWIRMSNPVRVNTKVLDASTGKVTELNESGAPLSAELIAECEDRTIACARSCEWMVLTGSTPPGCGTDFYARLTERIHKEAPECKIFLDAEGERLRLGLASKPDMIKPNQYELELFMGREIRTVEEIHAAAKELRKAGAVNVAVSMGGDGAYLLTEDGAWFAPAMKIPVRSTVGAGDSMVAGMLRAFSLGLEGEEILRHGVAAASSSVTTEGTELINADTYQRLLPDVELIRVE